MDSTTLTEWHLNRSSGNHRLIPWYLTSREFDAFPELRKLIEEDWWTRMGDLPEMLRREPRDTFFAVYAYVSAAAVSRFDGKFERCVRKIEEGLKLFPKSCVLHFERGRWLAVAGASKPALRKRAVEAWRTGLKLPCPDRDVARRVREEARFVCRLKDGERYGVSETTRRKAIPQFCKAAGGDPKESAPILEMDLLLQLSGDFRVHDDEAWGPYGLLQMNNAVVTTPKFTPVIDPGQILRRLQKRVWSNTELTKVESRDMGRQRGLRTHFIFGRKIYEVEGFSVAPLVAEFNRALRNHRIQRAFYEVVGIPEKGALCWVCLSPAEATRFRGFGKFRFRLPGV